MIALLVGGLGLLFITWGLFPAVLVAVARFARDPAATNEAREDSAPQTLPRVTAIFATRDAVDLIVARVENLLAQDYPTDRFDVVVALDASAAERLDEVAAAVAGLRVQVVAGDAPAGKPGALNAGVRAARGDLLLFADARQRFAPDVASRLVQALQRDPRLGAVSGNVVRPAGSSAIVRLYAEYDQRIREAEARLDSSVGVMGAIYLMRRSLWAPLPPGLILDDLYVPMRLVLDGHRVGVDLGAVAHETRRADGGTEAGRKVRTLTGNYQLMAWLPAVLVPGRNRIWAFFVLHKCFRLLTPLATAAVLAGGLGLVATYATRWPALGVATVALAGVAVAVPRLRGIATDFARLQLAAGEAMLNGMRGRWDVWR